MALFLKIRSILVDGLKKQASLFHSFGLCVPSRLKDKQNGGQVDAEQTEHTRSLPGELTVVFRFALINLVLDILLLPLLISSGQKKNRFSDGKRLFRSA